MTTQKHSDMVFQTLVQEGKEPNQPDKRTDTAHSEPSGTQARPPRHQPPTTSATKELTATGYGDLSRGPLICQRVADMAARAELAKLMRVQIQEHAIDRARERTGQPVEQDVEVVREEMAKELLHDVRITERRVDRAAGTCSSTAIMPKGTERRTPSANADGRGKP
ncbi:MAG: hypothetical protein ACRD2L_03535 [Terriglobia bacterium]